MNGCQSLQCCMLWNITGDGSVDNFAKDAKITDIFIFGQHLYLGSRKLEEVH